jgi:hypothetical protein
MPVRFETNAAATGRGLKAPYVAYSVCGDDVVLSVNDERNPEFWCNVTLTRAALDLMLTSLKLLAQEQTAEL